MSFAISEIERHLFEARCRRSHAASLGKIKDMKNEHDTVVALEASLDFEISRSKPHQRAVELTF